MIEMNFKESDLGLIPHDWEVKTISEVADNYTGLTYSPLNVCAFGGTLVLRSSNIQDDELSFKDNVFVNMEIPERAKTKENDVLICVRNGSSRLIGKSAMIPKEYENVAFGAFMTVLRAVKIDSGYLLYTWRSEPSQQQVHETFGATINQITDKDFKRILVPLPPTLAEQERIAGALSSIDTLIGALNEQIEKKRHIKQGTMQQLLTGKKRLAGFTGEWRDKKLDEMGFLTAGGTPSTIEPSYWGGDINWLQSGAVQNCIITPDAVVKTISKEGLQNSAAYLIKPDSVLIAITGATCANVGYLTFESAANQSVVSIEPNKENCAMFLFQKLLTERTNILSNKGGSAQSGVTLKALKQLTITIPPTIAEQSAIAAVLSGMDTEIAALERKRDKYIAIKSGMMQDLLTGKIRLV